MVTLRKAIPVLCLATSLAGIAVYAQTTATAPATNAAGAAAGAHEWHHHGHRGGGFFFVLHKLNLTAEQKSQVKSIIAGEKSQYESLHASSKANRSALSTTPPTDPGYPALIETAKTNAATRIKLQSETWTAIYSNVLTKQQQAAIPGIVAAAQQAREERVAAWKAAHPQATAPASE
jgi:Spy/CpxP family protein refolding chaperone